MSRLALVDLLLRDAAALVILKATLVLTLATAATVAAKGFSAARQHMLWLVALSSCVWLVLASPVVPAIMIHTPMLAQRVVTTAKAKVEASPATLDVTFLAADTVRIGNGTSTDQMRIIAGADGRSRGAISGSTAKDKFSIRPTSKSVPSGN